MDVFEGLGNTRSNRVWEAKLTPAAGGRRSTGSSAAAAAAAGTGAGGGGGDTWVLCGAEDVEVEGPSSSGRGSGAAAGSGVRSSTVSCHTTLGQRQAPCPAKHLLAHAFQDACVNGRRSSCTACEGALLEVAPPVDLLDDDIRLRSVLHAVFTWL
jgi:hypothetical protein